MSDSSWSASFSKRSWRAAWRPPGSSSGISEVSHSSPISDDPVVGLHLDEVDDALEVGLGAPRELQDERVRLQAVHHHVDGALEVRAGAVHLVHEADTRDVVAVGLTPDRLGLRLDAGDRVEHGDRPVEHAKRALHLDREVDVAGRVDDVDPVVLPDARGRRGRDRDPALALLDHPVHLGGALVDLAELVGLARVVEDPLGRGRLARVDVGHDPDVPGPDQWVLADDQALAGPGVPALNLLDRFCHVYLLRRGRHRSAPPGHGVVVDHHR